MYLAEKITWDPFSPKKKNEREKWRNETKRNETGGDLLRIDRIRSYGAISNRKLNINVAASRAPGIR